MFLPERFDTMPRSGRRRSGARESPVTNEQHKEQDTVTGQGQATVHDEDADPAAPKGPVTNGLEHDVNQVAGTDIAGDDDALVSDGDAPATDGEPEDEDRMITIVAERDEYLDQLQRSRAEFANFRRRNDQERAMLRQLVSRDVLAQFLPVIDDLDRALSAIPEQERGSGWVKGIMLIQSKLNATVERIGVTKIDALNKPFDPSLHEAVSTEPGTSGDTVVEVYQSGYRLGDILVRPAMVKTGDAPSGGTADTPSEQETRFNA